MSLTLGCGDNLSPEGIPVITGVWNYSETLITDDTLVSCDMVGTLTFEQNDERFVGSFTRSVVCHRDGSTTRSNVESGSISQGEVTEEQVRFRIGPCDYRGSLSGDEADRLSGSTLCLKSDVTAASAPRTDAGSWQAQRLSQPTS